MIDPDDFIDLSDDLDGFSDETADSKLEYYELLGISQFATQDEIKSAYKKLAARFHPDKVPIGASNEKKKEFEETFQKIVAAYNTLSDTKLRSQYDHQNTDYNRLFTI